MRTDNYRSQARRARKRLILAGIRDHWAAHNYAPTLDYLAVASGLAGRGNAIIRQLNQLEEMGLIERERLTTRTVRLTERGKDESQWPS